MREKTRKIDCAQLQGVVGPTEWSDMAIEMVAAKYFRSPLEKSVFQMIDRVAKDLTQFGRKHGVFSSKKNQDLALFSLRQNLVEQNFSFNSPVWFNCGLSTQYGLKSKSVRYFWDYQQKKVSVGHDAFANPQLSACFIQSLDDDLDSIFELLKNEASIFKYGSGSGTNFSNLRSRFEKLATGANSPGLIAFLEIFDRSAGVVKSAGTSRRAAKMVVLDIDHPEVLDLIDWKSREESKARRLREQGLDASFEGEISQSLSGQNSNNSIRLTDKFMKAVEKNENWNFRSRDGKKIQSANSAKALFSKLAQAAWNCADPGVQFHDSINRWHTCSVSAPIRASNPCSEYMFIDDSACNLASLNLIRFLDDDGNFLLEKFKKCVREMLVFQDLIVDRSGYPTQKIAQNSHDFRPLGLGFTGLGAFLMRKALPYNGEAARQWAGFIASQLTAVAYEESSLLAEKLGAFAAWKKNRSPMAKVLSLHFSAAKNFDAQIIPAEMILDLHHTWTKVIAASRAKGFRNSQVTAIAPTGTISFILDSETQGIEPEFAFQKKKNMSGGGALNWLSPGLDVALTRLGYSVDARKLILVTAIAQGHLQTCLQLKAEHKEIFLTAHQIAPIDHVKMMAAVQPHVSGAISKTVNLPNSTSAAEIESLYFEAWRRGLKSLAVYRDHSKINQPLETPEAQIICEDCGS